MLSNLVAGSGAVDALALFAGLVWGEIALAFVLISAGFGLLAWFVNAYVWVRVPDLEVALVFNRETKAFVRYLHPGRHFLLFPLERIEERLSLKAKSVRGKCTQAQTNGGIAVTVNWSANFISNPETVPLAYWPRLSRALPHYSEQMVRSNGNNIVSQIVSELPVEALTNEGAHRRLERELRQRLGERLRPLGSQLFRVMIQSVELPPQVQVTLEAAHERMVHANSEAMALERLHRAVNQFSSEDMEKLIQLKQLHELGQNGVTLPLPMMMSYIQGGGQAQQAGTARNGRKPNGAGTGKSPGADSGQDWPRAAH